MDKVFSVYMSTGDSMNARYASLSLPATPYELLDALDKTNVQDISTLHVGIEEYHRFPKLAEVMGDTLNICELNALAEKLSVLDETESTAFEGMLCMETNKDDLPIPLSRLIDFAYSTDCFHVLPDTKSYAQLGRFYAENGFVQETEGISDELFELLDFEKIGREMRQGDCGVFTSGGYVAQYIKLAEVYKDMDLTPKEPSYTVLLELSKGHFNDPEYDNEKTALLQLPAEPAAMDAALSAIDAWDWREVGIRCLDCRAPLLTDLISDSNLGVDEINSFAQKLADMDNTSLAAYKALLEAAQCNSFSDAEPLTDTLDQYIFSAKISSPEELARSELNLMLSPPDVERITPHLNLYNYGQELLEHFGAVLTDYGMIERRDGQPVQAITEQPQQGGMEMM